MAENESPSALLAGFFHVGGTYWQGHQVAAALRCIQDAPLP
jgi:hypothetical protein